MGRSVWGGGPLKCVKISSMSYRGQKGSLCAKEECWEPQKAVRRVMLWPQLITENITSQMLFILAVNHVMFYELNKTQKLLKCRWLMLKSKEFFSLYSIWWIKIKLKEGKVGGKHTKENEYSHLSWQNLKDEKIKYIIKANTGILSRVFKSRFLFQDAGTTTAQNS